MIGNLEGKFMLAGHVLKYGKIRLKDGFFAFVASKVRVFN